MLKQVQTVRVASEDNKIVAYIETDVALGSLHDFLMQFKGWTVDRMITAQKEEEAHAKEQMQENCKGEE